MCRFVAPCAICAQTKSNSSPPAGLLRPLPIPTHPRSHITMDFVTSLLVSVNNTLILTIVDLKPPTSFHSVNSPLLKKWPRLSSNMSSFCMATPRTSSWTVALSSRLNSGGNSADRLALRTACRQDSNLRQMGKLNAQIRFWVVCSVLWPFTTPRPGANSYHGSSMPIMLFPPLPQG